MMELDKKKIWIAATATLAFALLAVFGYVPIVWQKHVISQSLHRQSLTMEQVRTCVSQLPAVEEKISELKPIAEKSRRSIPENRQFASLWQEIAELMNRHNLQNQQVKPGDESQEGAICSVSLDIQCNGSLSDMFAFIGSLERMERLVRIEQMDLTNDKDYTGQLTLSAKAKVFYRTTEIGKPG
jgi:Tfp pilus assembly protein PilO